LKILLKEKVTVRETLARKAIESVGGRVESIYFTASAEYHLAMIAEYPDAALCGVAANVRPAGWFTEGFDMLDLKEAKALLDELHA